MKVCVTWLWLLCAAPIVLAQGGGDPPPAASADEATHEALRALLERCKQAIAAKDVETLAAQLHPNVVVTWPTGEVSRGPAGVRAFYDKLLTGPAAQLESYTTEVSVDELTVLYGGDTGVAWGQAQDTFVLKGGRTQRMTSRWTATVVLHEGRWVLASFAGSVNPFDNPVLATAASGALTMGGVGGAVLGLLLGFGVARVLRKT